MKTQRLSPRTVSGLAFLLVIVLAVSFGAFLLLFGPLLPTSVAWGPILRSVNTAACPAAIIVGVVAYFWARSKTEV